MVASCPLEATGSTGGAVDTLDPSVADHLFSERSDGEFAMYVSQLPPNESESLEG